jgi:hypothetical protein
VQLHGFEVAVAKADAHALELRVLRLRNQLEPVDTGLHARVVQREVFLQIVAAEQDGRRTRAQRATQLAHRDLVQVLVVDVEVIAVGLQQLLIGLLVFPDELARPREHERAARRAAHARSRGERAARALRVARRLHLLLHEHAARRMHLRDELLELLRAACKGMRGDEQRRAHRQIARYARQRAKQRKAAVKRCPLKR